MAGALNFSSRLSLPGCRHTYPNPNPNLTLTLHQEPRPENPSKRLDDLVPTPAVTTILSAALHLATEAAGRVDLDRLGLMSSGGGLNHGALLPLLLPSIPAEVSL